MSDDPIQNLLRDAEASTARPMPRLRVDRIEQIVRRRRITRRTITLGAPLLLIISIFAAWHFRPVRPSGAPVYVNDSTKSDEIEKARAEIAVLRAEADRREAMAIHMAERQEKSWQLARLRLKLAEPDALQLVRDEVESAAFCMVYQADRMAENPDLRS